MLDGINFEEVNCMNTCHTNKVCHNNNTKHWNVILSAVLRSAQLIYPMYRRGHFLTELSIVKFFLYLQQCIHCNDCWDGWESSWSYFRYYSSSPKSLYLFSGLHVSERTFFDGNHMCTFTIISFFSHH
jgi:hypothetical protein